MNRLAIIAVLALTLLGVSSIAGQDQRQGTDARSPVAFRLRYLAASPVAGKVASLLGPNARASFNTESNTVYLWASEKDIQRAREFINRRDVPSPVGLRIIELNHSKASETTRKLTAILILQAILGDDHESYVAASDRTNTIIFTPPPTEVKEQEMLELIRWLDRSAGSKN